MKNAKNAEIYEVLVLFVGVLGLNRLYVREPGAAVARVMYLLSALALTFTGLALLSTAVLAAAGGFYALLLVLWAVDYATLHRRIERLNFG